MNKIIVILGFLAAGVTACSIGSGTGTASQGVVLDVRCDVDSDCPSGFECEDEVEHGVDTSYCVSHDDDSGECPAGYELEVEHGGTFCKPHGGGGDDDGSGKGHGGDDD